MQFAYPQHGWWLLAVAAFVGLAGWGLYRRRVALRRLSPRGARAVGSARAWTKAALRSAAVVLAGVALLGPYWSERTIPAAPVEGRDVLFVLDVSRSMLTQDVRPDRLGRAKAEIHALSLGLKEQGGCRAGLVIFADEARLACPLTTDFNHFDEELKGASLASVRLKKDPESPPAGGKGTEIAHGLERALAALPKESAGPLTAFEVVLVSDGAGDDLSDRILTAAEKLAKRGAAIHVIGVGDAQNAAPIPNWYPSGKAILTRLEEGNLTPIAHKAGGVYARSGNEAAAAVLTRLAEQPTRTWTAAGDQHEPIHQFAWFLLPAIVLLVAECLIANARVRQEEETPSRSNWWLRRLVPRPQAARREAAELMKASV